MSKILILGSTGMLGQALVNAAKIRNMNFYGMADSGADFNFDVQNDNVLTKLINDLRPDVVINTIAIVSIEKCESNPVLSYLVNTRPVGIIAKVCNEIGAYFIQVSTDHYFVGDKDKAHSELDRVVLINEYARTKYLAEALTLAYSNSLVLRTNIVGFKGDSKNPTFVEWVINAFINRTQIHLFNDFFTSSIDVNTFADIVFDKIYQKRPRGILNVASAEVFSKKNFIENLSTRLGFDVQNHSNESSVFSLNPHLRAESLGLRVSKVEHKLNCKMPTMKMVIDSLASEYESRFL